MSLTTTARLRLREFSLEDAAFVLRLLNEPSFIANIADRGVRSIADAERYLAEGPMTSYARNGFGLWMVELCEGGEPAGMCGLIRRDGLEDVDIGYAFLPEHWGAGYASEAAQAALSLAAERFGLRRVVAIVSPGNDPSVRVLERLGFADEGIVRLKDDGEPLRFFGIGLGHAPDIPSL